MSNPNPGRGHRRVRSDPSHLINPSFGSARSSTPPVNTLGPADFDFDAVDFSNSLDALSQEDGLWDNMLPSFGAGGTGLKRQVRQVQDAQG